MDIGKQKHFCVVCFGKTTSALRNVDDHLATYIQRAAEGTRLVERQSTPELTREMDKLVALEQTAQSNVGAV